LLRVILSLSMDELVEGLDCFVALLTSRAPRNDKLHRYPESKRTACPPLDGLRTGIPADFAFPLLRARPIALVLSPPLP
jgi:hypothetical protein